MQIKAEQLAASLRKNSLPLIWISGDEPLLVQEACDTVRQFAREQGFAEREVLDAGKGFDWTRLLAAGNDMSLFAEHKLLDLRLADGKLDEEGRSALLRYLENPNPDNLLLLTTDKVEKASQSTKWFKALEARALFCQIWPVQESELPQWIGQRLHKLGMQADDEVLQLLADKVEGNLLAANQEVQKLRILSPGDKLDAATVLETVSDSSRFDVYTLAEACLAGNSARALKILQHLQAEGGEVLALLGALCGQIRSLAAMQEDLANGHHINAVLQNHRVWNKRTQMVRHALQQHNSASLQALLARARRVDQSAKRLLDLRPWDEITDLVLKFSDPRMLAGVI